MTEINDLVAGGVQFARTAERLGGVLRAATHVREEIAGVTELEPELKPEMIAALESLTEIVAATDRAMKFIDARFQVVLNDER